MCAKDKGMEEMLSSTNAVKKVTGSMLSTCKELMFVRINENVCVRDKCESWVNLEKNTKVRRMQWQWIT